MSNQADSVAKNLLYIIVSVICEISDAQLLLNNHKDNLTEDVYNDTIYLEYLIPNEIIYVANKCPKHGEGIEYSNFKQ